MTEWQKEDVIDIVEPDSGVASSYHTHGKILSNPRHMHNMFPLTSQTSPSFLIDNPGIVRLKVLFAKMRHLTEEHDTANKGNLQNLLF